MQCPIDGQPLTRQTVERNYRSPIHLDTCSACHGVWVDGAEFAGLMSHLSSDHQRTYEEWLQATHDGRTKPAEFWQESPRSCPRDGASMRKHYPGVAREVGVDQCPQCQGCWFDGSELCAVAKLNAPNAALDQAIAGAASGLQAELSDNYRDEEQFWWDATQRPETLVPHLGNLLLNLMAGALGRR